MSKLGIRNFLTEEDGIGTVEMILILVVLIGVTDIMDTISTKSSGVDI